MKDNTTVPSVRVLFPKDSYPPVHMLADICPCEKSTIKRVHIYYFTVFTALKSRNLFVSLSICAFPSCLFSCLTLAAASRPVAARTNSDPAGAASHHILGCLWLFSPSSATQQRLLLLYQSFPPCEGSMSISIIAVTVFSPLKEVSQHLKCPLEGGCGWVQEGRCWWLPQPFLWALGSCSCKCWLVKSL